MSIAKWCAGQNNEWGRGKSVSWKLLAWATIIQQQLVVVAWESSSVRYEQRFEVGLGRYEKSRLSPSLLPVFLIPLLFPLHSHNHIGPTQESPRAGSQHCPNYLWEKSLSSRTSCIMATIAVRPQEKRPIVFRWPGLNSDTRLTVFSQEFHVHSVLLKLHSAFFRKFLDSPDKVPGLSGDAASTTGTDATQSLTAFHYDWTTMYEDAPSMLDKKALDWHLVSTQCVVSFPGSWDDLWPC